MSASALVTPVPPPLPVTRSAQPPPTHVEFLLSQVRANLRYLSEIGAFDTGAYRQIHDLLTRGTLDPHAVSPHKNAWLRKVLAESSVLPTTVETALSLAAGPLLSDEQKEAIVQLVEYSQQGVANKITDPTLQKRMGSGARAAQSSTARKVSSWRTGLKQDRQKKKSESGEKKDGKRREKEEQRQIKAELKQERNEVIRMRQQQMLGANASQASGTIASPVSTSRAPAGMEDDSSSQSSSEDEAHLSNHGPINSRDFATGASAIADTATLTVLSQPIKGSETSVGGTNTTFVVEPGLAVSCSLVVIKGSQVQDQLERVRETAAAPQVPVPAETASHATMPPPSHPDVLAVRRHSGIASQPPVPPRPSTQRTR
ncbi:hypothetical protein L1887_53616 [Cichorium endivia]|nr:hypothetical protein L1887_53616 [Cichorium endivia]